MEFGGRFRFCWWIAVAVAVVVGCKREYEVYFHSYPVIVTESLPAGEVGVAYPATQLKVADAPSPYIWSDVNNTLQTYGLTLNATTGEIEGTPRQATPSGGVKVTISVTDALNNVAQKDLMLVIYPELQITTTALPDAYEGQVGYNATLTAAGGKEGAFYAWSVVRGSGSLPPNLSLAANGVISGDVAPTASSGSPYHFTVQVTDGLRIVKADLSIAVREGLQITTTTLPGALEGSAYSCTITASGGDAANYIWSISGQPSWLSIDATTGELSGTPPMGSAGSTYTFTVSVTDGKQTASKRFDLAVNLPPRADFEANPTQGTAPLTVTFTDKSTGSPISWEWDFDNDGTVDSTQQNPTYTYNSAGWYSVKLTVSNGAETSTCVKEMYILVANKMWYVNGAGGDNGNGGTGWGDAFATIGKALSAAGDYDLILVADATYNEGELAVNKLVSLIGMGINQAGAQPVIDCQGSGRALYFGYIGVQNCVIDNFVIKNGRARWGSGGAIYSYWTTPHIRNCVFIGNIADWNGGAIYCGSGTPTISNCTFSGNEADEDGGAIYCYYCDPTITDCTFRDNIAGQCGGAVYCTSCGAVVTNCAFGGNSANWSGGAVCFDYYSSPTVTNCLFYANSASDDGGALCCDTSIATIANCTFSGNSADGNGGALEVSMDSQLTVDNSILWQNSCSYSGDEVYVETLGIVVLDHCCVDKAAGGYGGNGTLIDSDCIYQDPQFVDAANGDYHLKDTSPCIDAGDNSLVTEGVATDLDGNPRIVNGTVDIGAYEKQ